VPGQAALIESTLNQLTREIGEIDLHSIKIDDLVRMIGTRLKCDWAVYWKLDRERIRLMPVVIWSRDYAAVKRLKQRTKERELSISEGNAGLVWRNQKPIWSKNLSLEMCLPRSLDANAAGLTCGIWFPIKTSYTIYGVIELLGRAIPPPTAELLDSIEALGVRIGEAIEAGAR